MNHKAYYDNCLYANIKIGQIPLFNLHDMIRRKSHAYFQTTKWQDFLLVTKYNRFLAHEVISKIKTITIQQNRYKIALASFACIL